MSYSTMLIRFVLGEYYEARLPVVAGRTRTLKYRPILTAVNKGFYGGMNVFTRSDVDRVVASWRISGGRLRRK